jgi:hypothetical protein
MPLPADGAFPLTGYSKPGEAATSRPKQAMIVRLSPETLDALQALQDSSDPQRMAFTFGDNPVCFLWASAHKSYFNSLASVSPLTGNRSLLTPVLQTNGMTSTSAHRLQHGAILPSNYTPMSLEGMLSSASLTLWESEFERR